MNTFVRSSVVSVGLFITGLLISPMSVAQSKVTIIAGDVPPFAMMEGGQGKGVAYDIVKEMAKRVGHSGAISVQPFARMLEAPKTDNNVLVLSPGRTPAREKSYKWVAKLVEEQFLMVGNTKSKADISSFESAKGLTAGVMRGSVGERIAKEKGFAKVDDVTSEDTNAKKLDAGRIDAWVGAWNTILGAHRAAGFNEADLRKGAVVEKVELYLAAGLGFDDAEAQRWVASLESMRKDGTYDRIIKTYKYELPK
jgi:polar amino acid transport system substrate-binding protein